MWVCNLFGKIKRETSEEVSLSAAPLKMGPTYRSQEEFSEKATEIRHMPIDMYSHIPIIMVLFAFIGILLSSVFAKQVGGIIAPALSGVKGKCLLFNNF